MLGSIEARGDHAVARVPARRIAVVGGGLSGAMASAALLRHGRNLEVTIFEPRPELGRGLAYSTPNPVHRVNAEPSLLSLDAANPADFAEWLAPRHRGVDVASHFATRWEFGLYAQATLSRSQSLGQERGNTAVHRSRRVVDIAPGGGGFELHLADGSRHHADAVILATGLFRDAGRWGYPLRSILDGPSSLDGLHPDDRIAVVGSGLTMIDTVATLASARHHGAITVLSRHARVPQVRRSPGSWPDYFALARPTRVREYFRAVVDQVREAERVGGDWQAVLAIARQHLQSAWTDTTDVERRRFLRHLRPLWESHHHRAPPTAHRAFEQLEKAGRVQVTAAQVTHISRSARPDILVTFLPRGEFAPRTAAFDAVFDAGGIAYDWQRVDDPLASSLLARGLVKPGPVGLGIAADAELRPLARDGRPTAGLFALGPPLRGERWETTAVPDIVAQAEIIANRLSCLTSRAG